MNASPRYVVTVNTDTTTGTPANCKDQNQSGATLDTSCSLRDAIAAANALNAGIHVGISFDPTAFATAQTITLAHGVLTLNNNMTITGATSGSGTTQANLVTVDGRHASSVFTVNSGYDRISHEPYSCEWNHQRQWRRHQESGHAYGDG